MPDNSMRITIVTLESIPDSDKELIFEALKEDLEEIGIEPVELSYD